MILDLGQQPVSNKYLKKIDEKIRYFDFKIIQNTETGLIKIEKPYPITALKPKFDWITYNEPEKHLNSMVKELQLQNVRVYRSDANNISDQFDFILNRAVGSAENIIRICRNKIKEKSFNKMSNGIICLKGGELEREFKNVSGHKIIHLNKFFMESFFQTKKIIHIPIPYTHRGN